MQTFQALGALLARYAAVFRESWQIRHSLDTRPRESFERAFLPAHLELIESPVHPLPMWTMRVIAILGAVIATVALVGRLDIVAVAPGKLIPKEQVKTIQPALTGVVRSILVRDGERVKAGQALMELDTTQAAADAQKARLSRVNAALTAERARALLAAQTAADMPTLGHVEGASEQQMAQGQQVAESVYAEYRDRLSGARAERVKREAELATTRQRIAKLELTAPLARRQANDYRLLSVEKYVAKTEYFDKEQTALNLEHELAAQRSRAREVAASIAQQRSEIAATMSQFRRQQMEWLDKATQQLAQNRNDETKADTRRKLLTLTAPVDGTVHQLRIHTLGAVATAASPVMDIVPDDTLEVDTRIENKDIGFIQVGQTAVVKVEAFPYTRYGYLAGTVITVSNDAVRDRRRGLTFPVRIRLAANRIRVNDAWIKLTPGMAVTAEIKTGERSVAGYFLDPVMRAAGESLRER
ncbi:MAG TPA: HlyD family type I secretion periplasmic adaptor subunit [Trinickia sp.]